jgi:hypothetical protein
MYVISKQQYEEFYVYGIFSTKESLDKALEELATTEIDEAKENKEKSQEWYNNLHKPWAERQGIKPKKPYALTVPLLEYSKSLFNVTEINVDRIIYNPTPMGWTTDGQ